MIEPPAIVRTAAQPTAMIALVVPRADIAKVMGPGIAEVSAALAAQGIAPAGPWLTYHRHAPTEVFDLEISVPVAGAVAPSGRVRPGMLPAATVARTVHHGDYEGLGDAWGELMTWITANGHVAAPGLWEVYAIGREAGDDPQGWRT